MDQRRHAVMRRTAWRPSGFVLLGVTLTLAGLFLPREWYDYLPKPTTVKLAEPPIKGVTLLQICFFLEGALLLFLGMWRPRWTQSARGGWLEVTGAHTLDDGMHERGALWALLAFTVLGLALRLYRLNADLWVDEITPISEYGEMSVLHVVTSYISSNNHLLNTLLVKGLVAIFGEREWAIRLPAALFGTATIPALYWLARTALTRTSSLGVALLLAVSYHHIFFSQNARGYAAYLFFSLVSTRLFIWALIEDRLVSWWLYVVTMVLNFATILLSAFVFSAHLIVGVLLMLKLRLAERPVLALCYRLLGVGVITALLGLDLYAAILPRVYVYTKAVYTGRAAGYELVSLEHAAELIRGISAGFGTGVFFGMLPFLLIAVIGFVFLLRRHSALALSLLLPEVLTATVLFINGLALSPRFFLLGLPLAFLSVVCGIDQIALRIGKAWGLSGPKLAVAAVGILCMVSLASLTSYYSRPKQDFRGAIHYVEEHRAPGDLVIALYLADWGYWFYGKTLGVIKDKDYFPVRSSEALESLLTKHPNAKSWVVMTLPRILRLSHPELFARIQEDWTPIQRFPGTVGDGEVSVWVRKPSPPKPAP
jgi:mannosyltransferase